MTFNDLINFFLERKRSLGYAAVVVGLVACAILYVSPLRQSTVNPEATPPNGLKVRAIPATLRVEARQQFRLQATTDFDHQCPRIDATIEEGQWQQSFTRAELIYGTNVQWNPTHTGTFYMRFSCDGRHLGDTRISVVMPSISIARPKSAKKFRWVLSYGKPIYRDDAFFQIPILASSEEQRGQSFVPSVVDHDIELRLLDRNGQLAKINPIIIARNTAISDPVYLPLPIGADYNLIAYEKDHGQPSNELGISWTQLSPKLSLVTVPTSVKLYSAAISSATVRVYLALDGRRIKPSQKTEILTEPPPIVRSDPANGVALTPDEPVGTYMLGAATKTGAWSVNFKEPASGVVTTTQITVFSTFIFFVVTAIAGLVGVLVGRQRSLFNQGAWFVLELICAAAAAVLLYGLFVAGLIPLPAKAEPFMFSYLAAFVLGLVGGYMGVGVFQLAKAVISKLTGLASK